MRVNFPERTLCRTLDAAEDMRPFPITTYPGKVLLPAAPCQESPSSSSTSANAGSLAVHEALVSIVVASCADNLTWVDVFLRRGYKVHVLEKCSNGRNSSAPYLLRSATYARQIAEPLRGRVRWTHLPNVGREAHSYLHYIVNDWSALRPTTIFLQGDTPRHGIDLERQLSTGGLLARFVSECWSFASLVDMLQPSTFRTGHSIPLSTFCRLWQSFDDGAAGAGGADEDRPCPVWTTAGWASFAVSRRTIRSRPLSSYRWWLSSFENATQALELWAKLRGMPPLDNADEDTGGADVVRSQNVATHARAARIGATFFERAWPLIFGCSSTLAKCAFSPTEARHALGARCPQMDMRPNFRLNRTLPDYGRAYKLFALVEHEVHPSGCRAMWRLASHLA